MRGKVGADYFTRQRRVISRALRKGTKGREVLDVCENERKVNKGMKGGERKEREQEGTVNKRKANIKHNKQECALCETIKRKTFEAVS